METSNIISVSFGARREAVTDALYQYDYGQVLLVEDLTLPAAYQVQFAKTKDGLSVQSVGGANGVAIPDFLLYTPGPIYAWFFLHNGETDGETRYDVYIPLIARAQPPQDAPTPEQADAISQAIAALNEAAEEADASAAAAATSEAEAASSAEDAEAWAVGERNGEPVTRGDETYLNNAKYYAAVAQQGAQNAGFAWFDIDDSTGEMNVTVTRDLGEDLEFQINENSGELEVIVHG